MQFGKTCTRKLLKDAQIARVLRTREILNAFQKLTRACFSQIALETILLPIQILIEIRRKKGEIVATIQDSHDIQLGKCHTFLIV